MQRHVDGKRTTEGLHDRSVDQDLGKRLLHPLDRGEIGQHIGKQLAAVD